MIPKLLAPLRAWPTSRMLLVAVLAASVLWAYGTTLAGMAGQWWRDPQYAHGFLVPVFAVFLLWLRRQELANLSWQSSWGGLGLLVLAGTLRLTGIYYAIDWFDPISLLPALAGICVLLGGWPALRWSWPAIAFLFYMVPLPYSVQTALAFPLRRLATVTSAYALQTVGFPALEEGTTIYLNDNILQIAPACSGLGMLLTFFALSNAMILLIRRPWLDKTIILLSALPIAILANIVRITITAALYELSASDLGHKFFHDWAGYFMMPIALVMLWLELNLLDRLIVPAEAPPGPLAVDLQGGTRRRGDAPSFREAHRNGRTPGERSATITGVNNDS